MDQPVEQPVNKYGTKKDGTPKQKPGRKLGYRVPKKTEES